MPKIAFQAMNPKEVLWLYTSCLCKVLRNSAVRPGGNHFPGIIPDLPLRSAPYSSSMIRYFFAMLWVMGAQICCQLMFVALENAKTSLFLALVRKVLLLVPLILLLPLILPDPVVAVYLAEPITDTLACTATVTMFVRYYRKYLSSLQK